MLCKPSVIYLFKVNYYSNYLFTFHLFIGYISISSPRVAYSCTVMLKFKQTFHAWSARVYYVTITKTDAISSSKVQSLNWHQYGSCPFQESLDRIWGWNSFRRFAACICFSEYDWATSLKPWCVLFCAFIFLPVVKLKEVVLKNHLLFLQAFLT